MSKKNEDGVELGFSIDTTEETPQYQPISSFQEQPKATTKIKQQKIEAENELISCLRKEKVIVRYCFKPNSNIQDQKHVLYGGMAETASRSFTIQMLRNGGLPNVLTDSEKAFLEDYMGMEHNALSIYLKKDNYWKNMQIRLTKTDTYLDLSIPEDYIKYKVLLTNTNTICPSLEEFKDRRKATYQFVLINEGEEVKQTNDTMSSAMEASVLLGTVLNDKRILKQIVETFEGRPISKQSKLDYIQAQAYKAMQSNPKLFISVTKDPLLKTKVLLSECLEAGIVRKRNDLYYLAANSEPLCENGEESTVSTAAKYLNSPKHQEVKFTLEAKLKAVKE